MLDNKSIKYLTLGSSDEGFLDEVRDDKAKEAIFTISHIDNDEGEFNISPYTNIEVLKNLPSGFRDDVLKVSNNVDWSDAEGFKLPRSGRAYKMSAKNMWNSSKPIGLELIAKVCKSTEYSCQNKNTTTFDNNNNDLEDERYGSNIGPIAQEDEFTVISTTLSVEYRKIELVQRAVLKSIVKRRIQYLKAGRSNDNFFFEGSSEDRTGASFSVQYNEGSWEGEFELIIDIPNLRTMDVLFRRRVIKIINNGLLLKNSTSFIQQPHSGKVKFDTKDNVWVVVSPLVITLSN